MSQAFERALQRVMRRMQNVVGRGRLTTAIDDTGVTQRGQLRTRAGNHANGVPMVSLFGFSSSPPIDSDVTYISFAGDMSSMVVIGTGHQGSRPAGKTPVGGVTIYDQVGTMVQLTNDGNATVTATGTVTTKIGGMMAVFSEGGLIVTNGDVIVDGISLKHHVHGGVQPGTGDTGPPAA